MLERLELNWVGKALGVSAEPRILIEDGVRSYCGDARQRNAHFHNKLIHGDNLLSLKALESCHRNSVKCIFLDPPYNTGSAFAHYQDGVEHSLWLSMMRE